MTPRFMDGQIVFIKEQEVLEFGEIGIFEHAGNRVGLLVERE